MTLSFTGIKNITVGKLPQGTILNTTEGSYLAQGSKATMYLDGKDLAAMKKYMKNNRLEVTTIKANNNLNISCIDVNGKILSPSIKNIPLLEKLGNIFTKILKKPDSKIKLTDEFAKNNVYKDIAGTEANKIKHIPRDIIEKYYASAPAVKSVVKDIDNDIKVSMALNLNKNTTIN